MRSTKERRASAWPLGTRNKIASRIAPQTFDPPVAPGRPSSATGEPREGSTAPAVWEDEANDKRQLQRRITDKTSELVGTTITEANPIHPPEPRPRGRIAGLKFANLPAKEVGAALSQPFRTPWFACPVVVAHV